MAQQHMRQLVQAICVWWQDFGASVRARRLHGHLQVGAPADGSAAFTWGAAPPGFVAGGHGDEVGDRLEGLRAQPEDRAELLGVDVRIADHGQQFHLLLQQAGLFSSNSGKKKAAGTPKVLAIASISRICGFCAWPLRSFQIWV